MYLPQVPTGHQFRILIVEDDQAILRLAALALKSSGFDIFAARDGIEAWDQIPQVNPHLLLADIKMPRLSGLELIGRVRRISAIPILMMTAHDAEDAQLQALKLGADDSLTKPFTPQLLTVRIAACLRRAYRYNGVTVNQKVTVGATAMRPNSNLESSSPASTGITRGMILCDSCNYIGPEWKFETRDQKGNLVEQCPHCHNKNITFALG